MHQALLNGVFISIKLVCRVISEISKLCKTYLLGHSLIMTYALRDCTFLKLCARCVKHPVGSLLKSPVSCMHAKRNIKMNNNAPYKHNEKVADEHLKLYLSMWNWMIPLYFDAAGTFPIASKEFELLFNCEIQIAVRQKQLPHTHYLSLSLSP